MRRFFKITKFDLILLYIYSFLRRKPDVVSKDESIITILYTQVQRFDVNCDDLNGSNAVQMKLLLALVSDINNVGSLSKSQITSDANKNNSCFV